MFFYPRPPCTHAAYCRVSCFSTEKVRVVTLVLTPTWSFSVFPRPARSAWCCRRSARTTPRSCSRPASRCTRCPPARSTFAPRRSRSERRRRRWVVISVGRPSYYRTSEGGRGGRCTGDVAEGWGAHWNMAVILYVIVARL